MDLTAMSLVDLKALAYDLLGQQQQINSALGEVNQHIAVRMREESLPPAIGPKTNGPANRQTRRATAAATKRQKVAAAANSKQQDAKP